MSETKIIMYGAEWCWDCRRARRYLDQHQIAYQWINIDKDAQAEQTVIEINRGNRSVPTILFPDGSVLVEPSNAALANKLEIT
jgi:glutaredoxin-like protein